MDDDPLDSLLGLEEEYYREGYDLGTLDGAHAGYVEGKLFGIEKGYEKGLEMGRIFGRALVWDLRLRRPAQELQDASDDKLNAEGPASNERHRTEQEKDVSHHSPPPFVLTPEMLPAAPASGRLDKHVQTLLALLDPKMLSLENSDDAVADLDDRLKRASAKVKIIERVVGETSEVKDGEQNQDTPRNSEQGSASTNNIEDLRNSYVRR